MKTHRIFLGRLVCWWTPCVIIGSWSAYAGSATWNANPVTEDWNTAANWTPETVPDGPADIASLAFSNHPKISISRSVQLSEMVFLPGASRFNITCLGQGITFDGVGITNSSGATQKLTSAWRRTTPGQIIFTNTSSAGDRVHYEVTSPYPFPGLLFQDNSTAGSSQIINNSTMEDVLGGDVTFTDSSNGGRATIINNGGLFSGGQGAATTFLGSGNGASTAADATLIAHGGVVSGASGGSIAFGTGSHAGNAKLMPMAIEPMQVGVRSSSSAPLRATMPKSSYAALLPWISLRLQPQSSFDFSMAVGVFSWVPITWVF